MRKTAVKVMQALIAIMLVSILAGCGQQGGDGATTLRVGHALGVKHPVHKGMERWAELLKEKSDGQLDMKIYPSGQLGQEKELIEQLQMGSLDFAKVSTAMLESFVPEMKVFSMPYLFRDEEHKWEALTSPVGQEILDACRQKNMQGIGYYEAGERSFYTIEDPIHEPEDLENMKIRVIKSPMAIELVKTLGASPTPISWGELYTSLQQGLVDGAENNPPSFVTARHYEACDYYTLDRHTSPMDIVVAAKKTWSTLSPENKDIVLEAFNESVDYQRELWAAEVEDNFETLEESGTEIIEPEMKPFREAVQPMYDKYLEDEDIGHLIEEIRSVE